MSGYKIIQVAPFFTPHIGGVESHVLALSRWLVREGYDVTVVSSKLGLEPAEESIDGIRVIRLRPLTVRFSTPINYLFRRVITKLDTDLIHAHVPPPITEVFAARAARELRVPFVLTYHCDLELPGPAGKIVTELYRRSLGLYSISQADIIIATTLTYHATSRSVWRYEPVIIPNAINAELFTPDLDGSAIRRRYGADGKLLVLFVGRLQPHKGLEYLVESAAYVDENVLYLVVGTGSFVGELKRLVASHKLEKKVVLVGTVSNEELPYYYAASDVFVLPSVSRLEAFGIVGLEAMASGKPTVVSNIPGVSEVIEDGREGLLAEPMNARSIADKLTMLLHDPELRKRMGANGRQAVLDKFHWGRVVKQFTDLYESLLKKSD